MSILNPKGGKKGRDLRQVGLLSTAPMIMLAAPVIGFGFGWWADSKFGTEPYLAALGGLMGVASAGIEIHNLIKKASAAGKEEDDEEQPRT